MTKQSKADKQVVADEAAAEVREVKREAKVVSDYDDSELAKLPACTQALVKAQKEKA